MGHANQSDFLADLCLALPDLAKARHVRDLAGESRGAGLAAGVGIDLGIQYQHLDRHFRHQRPRQVLETDVVHGAVTANGDHRWAQQPFLFAELLPLEVTEERIMVLGAVLAGELQFGQADGLETVCHLGHVALEYPHGHGGRVLKQVVGPGKRVGIIGVGGTPYGRAAGRIDDTHIGATPPGMAFGIQPLQVTQLLQ